MTWFGWVLIAWLSSAIANLILSIEKPRKERTPAEARFGSIEIGLVIAATLIVGTGHL